MVSDGFGSDNPLMTCLMRQPRRAGHITNGENVVFTCPHIAVCHHMAPIKHNTCFFKPEPFGIGNDTNGENHAFGLQLLSLSFCLDLSRNACGISHD